MIGIIILWSILMLIHKKIKIWRYKPENDKSRRAEESRGRLQGSVFPSKRGVLAAPHERYKLLPTASSDIVRTIKYSIGKERDSIREERNSNGDTRHPFKKMIE
jgi:hypothetical protein